MKKKKTTDELKSKAKRQRRIAKCGEERRKK